jgi:hypothetical protein
MQQNTSAKHISMFLPVQARLGAPMGVLAAFVVSGVMHEAMFSYITLLPPTGEAAAFFTLHGACAVAEGWWAAHEGWPRPDSALVQCSRGHCQGVRNKIILPNLKNRLTMDHLI